jgi:hypothetical protein
MGGLGSGIFRQGRVGSKTDLYSERQHGYASHDAGEASIVLSGGDAVFIAGIAAVSVVYIMAVALGIFRRVEAHSQ